MRRQRLLLMPLACIGIVGLGITGYSLTTQTNAQTTQTQTIAQGTQAPLREPDVVYVPTPQETVETMLKLANVGKNDVLYDLGSGDGRIPITAVQKYGVQRAVGIDINPERIKEANANAKKAGVTDRVKFLNQDLFKSDFSDATVVTLYLLPELNVKLRSQLFKQLKPGTRVVSHAFDMGDWKPEKVVQSPAGSTVYYWVIPKEIPQNLGDS